MNGWVEELGKADMGCGKGGHWQWGIYRLGGRRCLEGRLSGRPSAGV